MKSWKKTKQYILVIEFVSTNHYPTQKQIMEYLKDKGVSKTKARAFHYLKKELKKNFKAVIEYDFHEGGYYVNREASGDFEESIDLFQKASSIGLMTDDLKSLKEMMSFVMTTKKARGEKLVPQLIDLCKDSREVEISHKKYGENDFKRRRIQPYMIRELKGRWYVIGIEPNETVKRFRAYGLDRIRTIKKGEFFIRDKSLDVKSHYKDVVGIFNGEVYLANGKIKNENKTQIIRLSVDYKSWKWIDALPWHHSQKKVRELGLNVEFQLKVKHTPDLERLILEWSPKVKVLEPKELKESIVAKLKKSLDSYE